MNLLLDHIVTKSTPQPWWRRQKFPPKRRFLLLQYKVPRSTFQKRDLKIYSVRSHCFKICLIFASALLSRLHIKTYAQLTFTKQGRTAPFDLIITNVVWRMNYETLQALLIPLYNPLIIISTPSLQTFAMHVLGGLAKIQYGRTRLC